MQPFDDLHGTLQAAILLLLPVATGGLVFAFRAAPVRERVMRALAVTFVMVLAFFLFGVYFVRTGWPFAQILLPFACAWATIYVGESRLQQLACFGLLFVGLALMLWFALLAQGTYVGRRDWTGDQQATLDTNLRNVQEKLHELAEQDMYEYPPGDFAGNALHRMYERYLGAFALAGSVERPRRLWHTWLTSLHARCLVKRSVYYPGGRPAEGVGKMEWRDAQ